MELSMPNVVPPTPPVTCVPPSVVGSPLIVDLKHSDELSKTEIQAAGQDRVQLLGPFFDYQRQLVYVRRLVLTLPCLTSGKRTRDYAKARASVSVCGSAFGTTLGSVCAYLEGRGVPGERAYVLRAIRTQLLPIADAIKSMRGTDAIFLSRGLASCRVAHAQRTAITEPLAKIDSKYGNPYTCLGATATILACFGVMATVPSHAQHLVDDNSLVKTLRCVLDQLDHWRSSACAMADDAWCALNAERRALRRATEGARLAAYVWQDTTADEMIMQQISWARIAAFPHNTLVNEFTQPNILRSVETQDLFTSVSKDSGFTKTVVETVPLSQISEGRLLTKKGRKCEAGSDASESWVTLSSNDSSFSHVSANSLDGELVSKFGVM
jgi:hypothetical protein